MVNKSPNEQTTMNKKQRTASKKAKKAERPQIQRKYTGEIFSGYATHLKPNNAPLHSQSSSGSALTNDALIIQINNQNS